MKRSGRHPNEKETMQENPTERVAAMQAHIRSAIPFPDLRDIKNVEMQKYAAISNLTKLPQMKLYPKSKLKRLQTQLRRERRMQIRDHPKQLKQSRSL